jgi:hypothetical protein
LFSSQSSGKERKELIVLMRPTVLKTPDLAALASTAEKKRLPGVMGAEVEIKEEERKQMLMEEKAMRGKKAPLSVDKLSTEPPSAK